MPEGGPHIGGPPIYWGPPGDMGPPSEQNQPLQLLHMDLFRPTSVRSLNHKTYCLVITDDFNRFSWVFFLRTKDETSGILKDFIRQIENQLNQKVKTIRYDNGIEFKNRDFIEFCGSKGINREYSNARTPQENGVAERKNRIFIEAARTMLADSFLPNTFWAEAVSTACYVFNRVLVTKPQNKTPYELITGKIPIISYIRPFGCHVTILNTIDHLGKFDGKSDEGFLVGYSLQSKAFRVYNLETKRVEENLHITFLENKPNVAGKGPTWLFDLDYLTDSMNYQPVRSENQANKHAGPQEANQNAGTKDNIDAGDSDIEAEFAQDYFVLPIWSSYTSTVKSSKVNNAGEEPTKHPDFQQVDKEDQVFLDELERLKRQEQDANDVVEALRKEFAQETEDLLLQAGATKDNSTNILNTISTPVSTASPYGGLSFTDLTNTDQDDSEIPALEEIYDNPTDGIFTTSSYDDEGAVADFTNLEPVVNVDAMQEELLQFKIQKVWILVDLPYVKKAIGTKWVYRNKKDERGVMVRNKASAFLYGKIDEEVYVSQPPGFVDPKYPKKVCKVVKALYGLHNLPELSLRLLAYQLRDQKPLVKDEEASDVDVHLYRSMIGFRSIKTSHLSAVKRIFRYLKGKPKLGLWYLRVSSFDLEAYSDSDYAGANLVKKSTTGDFSSWLSILTISDEFHGVSWVFQESLGRDKDGIEALLLPNLFILALTIVSTDSAKLIPLGKDSTAIETLKKIPPRISNHGPSWKPPVLKSCPKHNMVAYLEKTAGNAEFHEVWMSAKSKIINNVRYITAKVAGKPVSISEASIRSDLLFNDADGIDSLPNQAIFDAIQLMDYEGDITVTVKPRITTHEGTDQASLVDPSLTCYHTPQSLDEECILEATSDRKEILEEKLDAKGVYYIDTEDAQDMGRTRDVVMRECEDEEIARKACRGLGAKEEVKKLLREKFTVEERAKFLHDTIAAQRRFLAEQRAIAIRNKPPTRTQLRNQMMTYLKHVGNKKHSDLKNKTFEEIPLCMRKVKRAKDLEQKRLKKKVAKETPKTEDTAKAPVKVDVTEQGTKKGSSRLDKVHHSRGISCYSTGKWNLRHSHIYWRFDTIMMESYKKKMIKVDFLDGTVIHMLVERRYPLSKDLLQRMLNLGLEVERESTTALDLIRFIKQQIDEN
ncbi:putative ribonuclease H-like domain-containing protein [Tanacetum coccineum]